MPFTAAELAKQVGGELIGNGSVVLKGFAPAAGAREGDLTFAENENYFAQAEKSAASAILVDQRFRDSKKVLICVSQPRVAFARILPLFFPEQKPAPGIHPTAVVSPAAQVDASAHVGPHCIIGPGAKVGAGAVLIGQDYVGDQAQIGEGTRLFPQVTIYPGCIIGRNVRIHAGSVIGSDGFGYVFDAGIHRKVPQIGNVLIGDDVEIGANVAIDRGALGSTTIGKGTKIDNLVQIAHNVVIGEHCLVVSQVGIAGSSKLGNYVTLAGQVGIAGHLQIDDQVVVAAQSGVMNNISKGERWFGSPARPDRQMKRQLIALEQLPELIRRVKALEKQAGTE